MSSEAGPFEVLALRMQLDAELRAREHIVSTASTVSRNLMNVLCALYLRAPQGTESAKDLLAAHAACALVEFLGKAADQLDDVPEKPPNTTLQDPDVAPSLAEATKTIH